MCFNFFFFFKQKTAYEVRISDWSSDVCSSNLQAAVRVVGAEGQADVADEVVVVAELLRLRGGTLLQRVERGRIREDRIAPADEHLGAVARGHVVRLVDAVGDLVPQVAAVRRHGPGRSRA